jgi:Protein of unknown function (DUF2380)
MRSGASTRACARSLKFFLVLPLALALISTPCIAAAQRAIAVFDVELLDTSGEGEGSAQKARLAMLSDVLRERLAESERYRLVDLAPVAEEIEGARPLYRCGGCQLALSRQAGADLALNVIVRKMSTLVQEIALIVADVRSDEIVAFHSVSIRNNSDRAWREGLLYILDNRLLRDDAP